MLSVLRDHASRDVQSTHLRDLLNDESRNNSLFVEQEGIVLDYSRQRVLPQTMDLLFSKYMKNFTDRMKFFK